MNYEKIDNRIVISDENGVKKEYEIIAYMDLNNKKYLVYTDGAESINGTISLYVNSVSYENNELLLKEIIDDELKLVIDELRRRMNI